MVTKQKSKFLSVSFTFLVGFSVMFCSIAQLGAAESVLYGAAHKGRNGVSTLYTIETSGPSAGVATAVGPIGFERCSAMDYDKDFGILYATCELSESTDTLGTDTHVLITIDTETGAGTEIGPTGVEDLDGPGQGFDTAPDMSFRNSDSTLFAYTFPGDGLATIDLSTGAMTKIGTSGTDDLVNAGGFGLAFSPLDVLFLAVDVHLLTLNPTNSVFTEVATLVFNTFPDDEFPRINAMDFQPETGTLFASVRTGFTGFPGPKENFLAAVDTTLGVVSTIGIKPTVDGLDALAFVPPSTIGFSTFTLKKTMVKFKHTPDNDEFMVKGKFVLGEGNDGINPVNEDVTVNVGTSSIVIPSPYLFVEETAGKYKFEGKIDGVDVKMKIVGTFDTFNFKIMAKGVDLTGTPNPVDVELIIGDDIGQSSIRLKGELNSWKKGKKWNNHHGDGH